MVKLEERLMFLRVSHWKETQVMIMKGFLIFLLIIKAIELPGQIL